MQHLPVLKDIYVIYNADGTTFGEMVYAIKKLCGYHCSACHITHGPREMKNGFRLLQERGWGTAGVHTLHRDELPDKLSGFVTGRHELPLAVAETTQGWITIAENERLEACGGSVGCFQRLVNEALALNEVLIPGRENFDYSEVFDRDMLSNVNSICVLSEEELRRVSVRMATKHVAEDQALQLPEELDLESPKSKMRCATWTGALTVHDSACDIVLEDQPMVPGTGNSWKDSTGFVNPRGLDDEDAVVPS